MGPFTWHFKAARKREQKLQDFQPKLSTHRCHFWYLPLSKQITRATQIRRDGEIHLASKAKSHYKTVQTEMGEIVAIL